MNRESLNLKKTLTNIRILEVLEIIGTSNAPPSSYGVAVRWGREYSPDRNAEPNVKHIYEIIKRLYQPGHLSHPERFLAKSYKTKLQNEILALEKKFDLLQVKPGESRSRWVSQEEDREYMKAESRICEIKDNPRNWRYSLNLKGFLLYLYNAQEHGRKIKTIYDVFSNISSSSLVLMDMKFLRHFEIFKILYNTRTLVGILTQIAIELKDMLSRMTPKFLRDYMITRCYEEVSIDISIHHNFVRFKSHVKKEGLALLQDYKVKILNDLIPIQKEKLKEMQEEVEFAREANNK